MDEKKKAQVKKLLDHWEYRHHIWHHRNFQWHKLDQQTRITCNGN